MNNEELKNRLQSFLDKWDLERVKEITLSQYVGVNDRDTFCQWVETRTRILGSIKGLPGSIKFGIYERKHSNKKPKNYQNDEKYSWLKVYQSKQRAKAFSKIKEGLIKTIKFSQRGDFESIDRIELPDMFKWKVAFLYSNEGLIPIYRSDTLVAIYSSFGEKPTHQTPISAIQKLMMQKKPGALNVFEFARELWQKFGSKEKVSSSKRRGRKAIKRKNTSTQNRNVSYTTEVDQRHNQIQEKLMSDLVQEYGAGNVLLEKDCVDIRVLQPDYIIFYEVKSNPAAAMCIREALGQLLFYAYYDTDIRKKKIVVAGENSPTPDERRIIDHLKTILKVDFDYLPVDMNNNSHH